MWIVEPGQLQSGNNAATNIFNKDLDSRQLRASAGTAAVLLFDYDAGRKAHRREDPDQPGPRTRARRTFRPGSSRRRGLSCPKEIEYGPCQLKKRAGPGAISGKVNSDLDERCSTGGRCSRSCWRGEVPELRDVPRQLASCPRRAEASGSA